MNEIYIGKEKIKEPNPFPISSLPWAMIFYAREIIEKCGISSSIVGSSFLSFASSIAKGKFVMLNRPDSVLNTGVYFVYYGESKDKKDKKFVEHLLQQALTEKDKRKCKRLLPDKFHEIFLKGDREKKIISTEKKIRSMEKKIISMAGFSTTQVLSTTRLFLNDVLTRIKKESLINNALHEDMKRLFEKFFIFKPFDSGVVTKKHSLDSFERAKAFNDNVRSIMAMEKPCNIYWTEEAIHQYKLYCYRIRIEEGLYYEGPEHLSIQNFTKMMPTLISKILDIICVWNDYYDRNIWNDYDDKKKFLVDEHLFRDAVNIAKWFFTEAEDVFYTQKIVTNYLKRFLD